VVDAKRHLHHRDPARSAAGVPAETGVLVVGSQARVAVGKSTIRPAMNLIGEPPDSFWWDPVRVSLWLARQIDSRSISNVDRRSMQSRVEVFLHPDTTNIKLVARCRELSALQARIVQIG
jgi:hypothetical protein